MYGTMARTLSQAFSRLESCMHSLSLPYIVIQTWVLEIIMYSYSKINYEPVSQLPYVAHLFISLTRLPVIVVKS